MKKDRICAAAAVIAMAASLLTIVPLSTSAENYTPVAGGTTSFDKYLVMNEERKSEFPEITCQFTLTAGTAKSYDTENDIMAILPGPDPDQVKFKIGDTVLTPSADKKYSFSFSNTEDAPFYTVLQPGDGVKGLTAGKGYFKKEVTLDFSDVTFDEPGIYRYVISEIEGDQTSVSYDQYPTRALDVYVIDDADAAVPTLAVGGYILHSTADGDINSEGRMYDGNSSLAEAAAEDDSKSVGFTNEYGAFHLTFGKEVTGNQGSKDKYFKFTVSLTGAAASTDYIVDLTYATSDALVRNSATKTTYVGETNPQKITTDTDGAAEVDFYLHDGQYITIMGLNEGATYEITEDNEDYASAEKIAANLSTLNYDGAAGFDALDGEVKSDANGIQSDVYTGFTNTKNGTIPTGVLAAIAGPSIVGLIVLGGIIFLIVRIGKRRTEEE